MQLVILFIAVIYMRNINPVATTSGGPFDLDTKQAYLRWRQAKLRSFPETLDSIKVAISNPRELTPTERASLVRHCRSVSMAIYSIDSSTCSKADLVKFGQQLGLNRLDVRCIPIICINHPHLLHGIGVCK